MTRLLVVGCGDVGQRLLRQLRSLVKLSTTKKAVSPATVHKVKAMALWARR